MYSQAVSTQLHNHHQCAYFLVVLVSGVFRGSIGRCHPPPLGRTIIFVTFFNPPEHRNLDLMHTFTKKRSYPDPLTLRPSPCINPKYATDSSLYTMRLIAAVRRYSDQSCLLDSEFVRSLISGYWPGVIHVDLSRSRHRSGARAMAHCHLAGSLSMSA